MLLLFLQHVFCAQVLYNCEIVYLVCVVRQSKDLIVGIITSCVRTFTRVVQRGLIPLTRLGLVPGRETLNRDSGLLRRLPYILLSTEPDLMGWKIARCTTGAITWRGGEAPTALKGQRLVLMIVMTFMW